MAGQMDALELIADDHRRVEQLFASYEQATDTHERTEIVHAVIHELAVHGEVEELIFYPRLRAAVPGGDDLAEEAVHEHLEIKETLNTLDGMTAEDDGFDQHMRTLIAAVRHHVEDEEGDILPKVRAAVSAGDLRDLGEDMQRAKALVPTRPHPGAPTGPLAKFAASPPVALVDRVRDVIREVSSRRG